MGMAIKQFAGSGKHPSLMQLKLITTVLHYSEPTFAHWENE
jgi:hypothetical protein